MTTTRMLGVLLLVVFPAVSPVAQSKGKSSTSKQQSLIARGEYLVNIAGCNDCHSPKAGPMTVLPDKTRLLSGRPPTTPAPAKPVNMGEISGSADLTAWYGPWGISYAANLTPHPTTGLAGRYNEASFIKTLRTGRKPEGEPLLPPMPWENIGMMTDSDLKAVWAYLQSIKPIDNFVRSAVVPAPVTK